MTLLALVHSSRSPGPLGLLAVVVVCGGLVTSLRREPAVPESACVGVDGLACVEAPGGVPAPAAPPVVARSEACGDAAYLCEGLAERGALRVLRWDGATSEILVLVPMPEHEDASVGRQLQQAAARGIRAWDGHPFPIRIELREREGLAADITVRWTQRLGATELGVASTQWGHRDGRLTMTVNDFALSTRSPFDRGVVLPPRQVELTAAHEMGHALGLPHSSEERDVMYATNTASALSARDYRAMETLYRLENGAEIR
ncbi:MAG: matrixin family metalloprotease [Gemmatimonadetes bacterium]|nr:matrixin family metalloprotease [Gemmatimonadota bacterium]